MSQKTMVQALTDSLRVALREDPRVVVLGEDVGRNGGGIRGGLYHSQSPEAYFAHTAGLQVVIPSTPSDAKGLLLSAIAGEDPVMFLEPKRLYRTLKEDVAEGSFLTPIGKARTARAG